MENNIIRRTVDLSGPRQVEALRGVLATTEENAHTFIISATRDGAPVALSGVVAGAFVLPDGTTVPLEDGYIEDGAAVVTLNASCYALPGRFELAIFATADGATVALYLACGSVVRSQTEEVVDPGDIIPSVQQLINDIDEAVASIPADYSALVGEVDNLKGAVDAINPTLAKAPSVVSSDAVDVDIDITDDDGNVILRLADGHIQTKGFDSRDVSADTTASPTDAVDTDIDFADSAGNVIVRFAGGHIQTKEFDSRLARQLAGKKWVVIGDSLTEHNQRATKNYHDYVADETGITVVNLGRSGRGYAKVAGDMTFVDAVSGIPQDADVITIFGSGNDMGAGLDVGSITDTGTATLCGCVNAAIDAVFDAFPLTPFGIITPTPWINNEPSDGNTNFSQYSAAIVDICRRRGVPCLDLYHCSNLHPDDADFREIAYSRDEGDGVHPDENGHKIIAPRFREFLYSLI